MASDAREVGEVIAANHCCGSEKWKLCDIICKREVSLLWQKGMDFSIESALRPVGEITAVRNGSYYGMCCCKKREMSLLRQREIEFSMESAPRPVGKITAAAVKWLRDYRRERLCCSR